ncbi:hypothetical protein [Flavobacterium sp.]|uniref:hypothetical protein n=1 Tax=Flavobacterium sp. TaxID=239 RepID=UPI0026310BB1|nr:hypothetical protein [Flavobacterium sp.]
MRKTIVIVSIFLVLVSCGKMMTRYQIKTYNALFMVWHYTNGKKDVQFIPMAHLNKPEKFARIRQIADSLRSQGYVIYYESVELENPSDSLRNETIQRKFRRVIGIVPGDYSDKNNKSYRALALEGYVMQTMTNTGCDRKRDKKVDLSMDSLVALYEKERGEIKLTQCDWNTPYTEKYRCHRLKVKDQKFMALTLRNRYLSYFLTHSKDKKIVVMYGAEHEKFLEDDLKKEDPNWKMVHNSPSIRW